MAKIERPEQAHINACVRHLRRIRYPGIPRKGTPKLHIVADCLSKFYQFDCPRDLGKRERLRICFQHLPEQASALPLSAFAHGVTQRLKKPKDSPEKALKTAGNSPQKKPNKDDHYEWVNSDQFLSSYEWRKLRYQALVRSAGKCEVCGAGKPQGAVLNVDHIKPRRKYPLLALRLSNTQVTCGACNHGKGNWDETDWRSEETKAVYIDDWEEADSALDSRFFDALTGD